MTLATPPFFKPFLIQSQGMAYGIQIGVPVIHGLYGAIFFGIVYAVRAYIHSTTVISSLIQHHQYPQTQLIDHPPSPNHHTTTQP